MTCAACARRIEKATGKLPGMLHASVNLASEKLFAEHDGSLTAPEIIQAVQKLGYDATEETQNSTVIIPVGGMTCAACAGRIEKVLGRLSGVVSASVNLVTEKATVKYHPQKVRQSDLREAIEKTGYAALEISKVSAADEDSKHKQKEIRAMRKRFIVAAAFALPLLYIAMAPMITFTRLPVPLILDPMLHPLIYALAQLALIIPVICAGYRFYTVGFRALWQRSPKIGRAHV